MTRVAAMRTLENALRRWLLHRRGRRRSGPRLSGRSGLGRRRRARSRPPHCRRRRLEGRAGRRARAALRAIMRQAVAWAVASARPARDRSHQHPSRVARGDAPRRDGARAAARHRAGRCVPHSRSADGPARRLHGDRALHRDCRRVDRRQGDPRPRDAGAARSRIRATASTVTRATRPPTISPPSRRRLLGRAPALVQAVDPV